MKPLSLGTSRPTPDGAGLPAWLRVQLEAIFDAIQIVSPTCFRFAGGAPVQLSIPAAAPAGSLMAGLSAPQADAAHPLAEAMWPLVYNHCYARPLTLSQRDQGALAHPAMGQPDAAFIARLSAANRSQSRWDPMWKVYQLGQNGAVHVQKGEVYRLAMPGEYAYAGGPGRMPAVGHSVDLLVLRESTVAQPGFYYAFGETVASEFDDAQLSRLYFHPTPEVMPWLLEKVSGGLNGYQVPFRMKCLNAPESYDRTDAAVLYIARRFLPITLRLLHALSGELAQKLEPGVPLFTRQLCPGVGLADEPGTGESFGQSRARLVCQGVVDAWLRGHSSQEARLQAVSERFARLGLSLASPHLSEGVVDAYQWPDVNHDVREAA